MESDIDLVIDWKRIDFAVMNLSYNGLNKKKHAWKLITKRGFVKKNIMQNFAHANYWEREHSCSNSLSQRN